MDIIIIGVEPPCPRCRLLHEITRDVLRKLGLKANVEKIDYTCDEAHTFGRVGSAHDIAQWAGIDVDWDAVSRIASVGWSPALDDMLMPCKQKADAEGWLMTPVLVIDGKIASMGYVPARKYIRDIIQQQMMEEGRP
jgi:hypothetical protein